MSDYKAEQITGWQRSCAVQISNPRGGTPQITYTEEIITKIGEVEMHNPCGAVSAEMTDPAMEFPLLNPADDSVIGTATPGQIYALLYSHYRYVASQRDLPGVL